MDSRVPNLLNDIGIRSTSENGKGIGNQVKFLNWLCPPLRSACRTAAAGHRGVRQARQPQGFPQDQVRDRNKFLADQTEKGFSKPVLRIHGILLRIRVRGYIPLTNGKSRNQCFSYCFA